MIQWSTNNTHNPCLVTTLTVTRALCSRKQRGVTELSSPLCVLENSSLKRSTRPHEITDSLLVYLWQGQTHTLQIPVLCFINDYLNCLSPLINWNTRFVSKPWISCSPSSRPVDSGRPSAWACRRPLLRTGCPQGETVTHLLSCNATHSSHFHTVVLSGLVCSSLETKPLFPHAWKVCRFSAQELHPTVTAPLPSYNTLSPGPHSHPSKESLSLLNRFLFYVAIFTRNAFLRGQNSFDCCFLVSPNFPSRTWKDILTMKGKQTTTTTKTVVIGQPE